MAAPEIYVIPIADDIFVEGDLGPQTQWRNDSALKKT